MTPVDVNELQSHLAQLLERAERGEEIVIARAGTPIVKLVPAGTSLKARSPGYWRGQVWMADDFDELPEDIAAAFDGETP